MFEVGSVVRLEITDLATNGKAVARLQQRVVFVPNGVPGDLLLARLSKVKPSFAEAHCIEVLQPSSLRTRPSCSLAEKCGGCQWQNVEYSTQLTFKQKQVKEALKRIGRLEGLEVEETLASQPLGYRNKVTYCLEQSCKGRVEAGFRQKGSHEIVDVERCPVQDSRLNDLFLRIKRDLDLYEVFDDEKKEGTLRHLALRIGQRTGEVLVVLVSTIQNLPLLSDHSAQWMDEFPCIVGVCLNINPIHSNKVFGTETVVVQGESHIKEHFCGLEFQIGPTAFFQINTSQAENMAECMINALNLQGSETIVDGYTGIGTLILPIASQYPKTSCWAIDSHEESVRCAEVNAHHNKISNVCFKVGRFENLFPKFDCVPDIVLLNPPRKGCHTRVLTALLEMKPRQIVYISCKPSTLARDLGQLCHSESYECASVMTIDLFPQTAHIETITIIKRKL